MPIEEKCPHCGGKAVEMKIDKKDNNIGFKYHAYLCIDCGKMLKPKDVKNADQI